MSSPGYGDLWAPVYDDVFAKVPVEPVVARLAELAAGGPVLEFAIGTGRIALPLARRGLAVSGLDNSPEMLARLSDKPGADALTVELGDMTSHRIDGDFTLVFAVFNSLYLLDSQDAQLATFRNAAAHLRPGGRFVVEGFLPDPAQFTGGQAVQFVTEGDGHTWLVLSTHEPLVQAVTTTNIRLTAGSPIPAPAGAAMHAAVVEAAPTRVLSTRSRYVWPSELDLMASVTGFVLEDRTQDWYGTQFEGTGSHVSVYRRS
ncbi:class I SAM-dependent methyltransferase [Plantactinospora endophytica]|uniref:Methyltransferase n=1 Tax=Plantactinospora endophytica TaxID=673535 RepID=A0ABQ4E9J1_9ACTN|nr:class I SAM-dependent methyltransferase [Plantactinospora endophytica]GIG91309.1 methyltransferase [Plantactinospora endophytica]